MDIDTSSPTSNGTKRVNQIISNEVRKLIIHTINSGEDQSVVAKMFKVKPTTVRAIYSTFKKTGLCQKKKVGNRKSILSDSQKEEICNWVDEDCTLTLKQLVAKCLTEINISLSKSTVKRALKHFHYSFKRFSSVPIARNTPQVIEQRYQYAIDYNRMMVEREKMFFLDETGVQIFSRATFLSSRILSLHFNH
jgi:transposase